MRKLRSNEGMEYSSKGGKGPSSDPYKVLKLGEGRGLSKNPKTRPGRPHPGQFLSSLFFPGPGWCRQAEVEYCLRYCTFPGRALTQPVGEEGAWLSRFLNSGQPRGPQPHPGLSRRGMKCFID